MSDPNSTSDVPQRNQPTQPTPSAPEPDTPEQDTSASTQPSDGARADEPHPHTGEHAAAPEPATPAHAEPAAETPTAAYPYERQDAAGPGSSDHTVTEAYSDDSPTEHVLTGPEPAHASAPAASPSYDTITAPPRVEIPPEPKRRGNRVAGIGIAVIQALIFAAAMFGVLILLDLLAGEPLDLLGIVLSPAYLITVGMFFIGLVIVALLVNRAGWWSWILGGLLIAAFAYIGWIGGLLVQEAMTVPSNRVLQFVWDNLLTWPAIAAFLLGREIPIWFGALAAARGRRVAARNREDRAEYERQLDDSDPAYR